MSFLGLCLSSGGKPCGDISLTFQVPRTLNVSKKKLELTKKTQKEGPFFYLLFNSLSLSRSQLYVHCFLIPQDILTVNRSRGWTDSLSTVLPCVVMTLRCEEFSILERTSMRWTVLVGRS